MKRFPLIALVFTFILSACGPSPEQQATMTATAATATAAGWTKTPTPTSTPTNTPTPTSTNTPTPTPTPVGGSGRLVLGINRYDTSSSSNIPGVYLYDLSTHKATLLFEGFSLWGRVSPDGNKLLVSRQIQGQNNSQELYAVDLNGSNSTLLYRYVFNQFAPIWLPGTNWIAFLAFINQKVQVFVIHPDGTGLTQVTQSTIGVGEILSAYDGGIYWEEALSTRSGYYSHGYRWTKIDGSDIIDNDETTVPACGASFKLVMPVACKASGAGFDSQSRLYDSCLFQHSRKVRYVQRITYRQCSHIDNQRRNGIRRCGTATQAS